MGDLDMDNKILRRIQSSGLGVFRYKDRITIWNEETLEYLTSLSAVAQGAIAADTGDSLAHILASKFNKNYDGYDKAIDSAYNAGNGGSSQYHHIIDGQHSFWGAMKAVHDVSPDDSFMTEMLQAVEHLVRDMCSVSGIPLIAMNPETFNAIAGFLSPLGISKAYLADALTYNAVELIGASIGTASLLLGEKSLGKSRMSELNGSLILSTIAGANPLLMGVAAYGMYRCNKTYGGASLVSMGKGALVTGSVVTVSNLIGGPVWLGLAAAIAASIGVRYGIGKIEDILVKAKMPYKRFGEVFPQAIRTIDYRVFE
jgi:hypothetical protein